MQSLARLEMMYKYRVSLWSGSFPNLIAIGDACGFGTPKLLQRYNHTRTYSLRKTALGISVAAITYLPRYLQQYLAGTHCLFEEVPGGGSQLALVHIGIGFLPTSKCYPLDALYHDHPSAPTFVLRYTYPSASKDTDLVQQSIRGSSA